MRHRHRILRMLLRRGGRVSGFTLIELLVVIFIIALLLSILATALSSVRQATRSLVCKTNLHTVALEFRMFADRFARPWRGDSESEYGQHQFSAWDFQQRLYQVDEFWDDGGGQSEIVYSTGVYKQGHAMVCPASPGELMRDRGTYEGSKPTPAEHVSYSMNRRLIFAPIVEYGYASQRQVPIDERILERYPLVPLFFDVDAPKMMSTPVIKDFWTSPFFCAPEGTFVEPNFYGDDRFWFPAKRHRGKMSIAFVDGHVISTAHPTSDPAWDWDYHPPVIDPVR